MPPAEEVSTEYASAALVRGCIAELRYPRICAARQCRRHKRCIDVVDRSPRCVASLHPVDHDRCGELYRLVVDILEDRYPPQPSRDPVIRDREHEAIRVAFDCLDTLPCFRDRVLAWDERYYAPPQPAVPPIDTGALLRQMKAELEIYRLRDSFRDR